MADLQTNLQRLENNSDEILSLVSDISDAIIAKGGTVPANTGLRGFANAINSIPSGGGGGASKNDVTFYDYDGTIVQSYSAADFANLSELPANPSHDGLTAQGWNWALADAKTYVASYGKLDIGQMYTTDDGNTRLHIRLGDGRLKPYLGITGKSSGTIITINWGDGSSPESVTLDTSTIYTLHEYTDDGDYTISINVTNGSITFNGDSSLCSNIFRKSNTPDMYNDRVYQSSLIGIEIGNNVNIGNYAFYGCSSLQSITIPDSVNSISSNSFNGCSSLSSITIPDSVTSIGSSAFFNCSGLGYIRFKPTTPPTVSNSNAWTIIPTDCIILAPALVINIYMNGTKYPDKATYTYLGYATYESDVALPTTTTDETYNLTWYATQANAISQTNPITQGNGNEVYAIATAI